MKEHFIGFKTVDESSGESLTELIMNTMNEYSICIQNCRGQGYDNGANMKGKNKGVQARILAINSRASFVPCGCHSLNLVISDAASSSINSISLFGVIQRLYVLFSASVHRWKILTTHVIELTFKPLCSTRWESRINSVKAVRYKLPELYDALMELAESPSTDSGIRHEALSLASYITEFKFLVSVVIRHDILSQVNIEVNLCKAK